jgi:hypothetical protein
MASRKKSPFKVRNAGWSAAAAPAEIGEPTPGEPITPEQVLGGAAV